MTSQDDPKPIPPIREENTSGKQWIFIQQEVIAGSQDGKWLYRVTRSGGMVCVIVSKSGPNTEKV